ncbi:unnamed protein product [Prorocentrum cordatum]|uniref:EF-hand domain-containing protein n=1 Tax=Prorocentrum cordatum TaxID=2364126 RepID=A0ABN9SMK0_9DINO|nr:unnamed protein product [Polarella glacialis]
MKAILEAHIGQLKDEEISPEKCITPEDMIKQFQHFFGHARFLRRREATAALTLAKAEKSKLQAVRALAELNGVVAKTAKDSHGIDGNDSKKLISISWDEDFFSTLDKLEVSETERADLKQLETDLKGVRDLVGTKSSEVERMLARMAKMKEDIMVRMAKKRKGPDGVATGSPDGGGSSGEPGGARVGDDGRTAAETTPVRDDQADAELAEEARRLSEAKLAAAQAAQGAGLSDNSCQQLLCRELRVAPKLPQAPRPKLQPQVGSKSSMKKAADATKRLAARVATDECYQELRGDLNEAQFFASECYICWIRFDRSRYAGRRSSLDIGASGVAAEAPRRSPELNRQHGPRVASDSDHLVMIFWEREGFSRAELMELDEAFNKYDTDQSGTIDTAELGGLLAGLGHRVASSELTALVVEHDGNRSGSLDDFEFLRLMRQHRDGQLRQLRGVFRQFATKAIMKPDDTMSAVVVVLGSLSQRVIDEINARVSESKEQVPAGMSFNDFVEIVDYARSQRLTAAVSHAGFSEQELSELRCRFVKYDSDPDGTLDHSEIRALLDDLNVQWLTRELADALRQAGELAARDEQVPPSAEAWLFLLRVASEVPAFARQAWEAAAALLVSDAWAAAFAELDGKGRLAVARAGARDAGLAAGLVARLVAAEAAELSDLLPASSAAGLEPALCAAVVEALGAEGVPPEAAEAALGSEAGTALAARAAEGARGGAEERRRVVGGGGGQKLGKGADIPVYVCEGISGSHQKMEIKERLVTAPRWLGRPPARRLRESRRCARASCEPGAVCRPR